MYKRQALLSIATAAQALGYGILGACASPVPGAEGNREFFLHLVREGVPLAADALEEHLKKAVGP